MSDSEPNNEFLESIGYDHQHNVYGSSISEARSTHEGCILKKPERGFRYANYEKVFSLDPNTEVTIDDIEVNKTTGNSIEYVTVDTDTDTIGYYLQGDKQIWHKEIADIVSQSLAEPDLLIIGTTNGKILGLDLNLKGLVDFEYLVELENDLEGINATEEYILIHDDKSISLLELSSGEELYSDEIGEKICSTALIGDLIVVDTTESFIGITTSGIEKFKKELSPDSVNSTHQVLHLTCDESLVVITPDGEILTIQEEFRGKLYQMSASTGIIHQIDGDLNLYERKNNEVYFSLEFGGEFDKYLTITNISDQKFDNIELRLENLQHKKTGSDSIEITGGLLPGEQDSLPMKVVGENPTVRVTHSRGDQEEILLEEDDTTVSESTPTNSSGSSSREEKLGDNVEGSSSNSTDQKPASKPTEVETKDEHESGLPDPPKLYEKFRQGETRGDVGDKTSTEKYDGLDIETLIEEEKIEFEINDANSTVLNKNITINIDFSTQQVELKILSHDQKKIESIHIPIEEVAEKFDLVSEGKNQIDQSSQEKEGVSGSSEPTSADKGLDTADITTGGSPRFDLTDSAASGQKSDGSQEESQESKREENSKSHTDKHRRPRHRNNTWQDRITSEAETEDESEIRGGQEEKKETVPLDESIRSYDDAGSYDLNRRFYKVEWNWQSNEPKRLKECEGDTIDVKIGEILIDILAISLPMNGNNQNEDAGSSSSNKFSKIKVNSCYERENRFVSFSGDDIWKRNHEIYLYSTITFMNDMKKEVPDRTVEIDGTKYHANNKNSNQFISSSSIKGNELYVHPYLYSNSDTGLHEMRLEYGPNAHKSFNTDHMRGYVDDIRRTRFAQADQGTIHTEKIAGTGYSYSTESPVIIDDIRLNKRKLAGNGIPYRFKFGCPASKTQNPPSYISTVAPILESSEWKNQTCIINGLVLSTNSAQFED